MDSEVEGTGGQRPAVASLLEAIAKGRPLPAEYGESSRSEHRFHSCRSRPVADHQHDDEDVCYEDGPELSQPNSFRSTQGSCSSIRRLEEVRIGQGEGEQEERVQCEERGRDAMP